MSTLMMSVDIVCLLFLVASLYKMSPFRYVFLAWCDRLFCGVDRFHAVVADLISFFPFCNSLKLAIFKRSPLLTCLFVYMTVSCLRPW